MTLGALVLGGEGSVMSVPVRGAGVSSDAERRASTTKAAPLRSLVHIVARYYFLAVRFHHPFPPPPHFFFFFKVETPSAPAGQLEYSTAARTIACPVGGETDGRVFQRPQR